MILKSSQPSASGRPGPSHTIAAATFASKNKHIICLALSENFCRKTALFPCCKQGTCHLGGDLDWKVSKTIEGALGSRKEKECRFKQPIFFLLFKVNLALMEELQPQRLSVSVYLKGRTGQKVFPVAGHRSSLVKSSQHQDSVMWNPAGAQSRDQRMARWEVRTVECQEFPSKPHPVTHTDLAVDVSWLKPLKDGSDIPLSSWVRVFCWEWQPRFPYGVEHSLCCKELRAGASQRWLLICTAWDKADHKCLFLPG